MTLQNICLPYGDSGIINLRVEDKHISGIAKLNRVGKIDLQEELNKSLYIPTGTDSLVHLAGGKKSILIICDDITRPTPVKEIIPVIIEHLLQAKISRDNIKILIANGSHRSMNKNEIYSKIGSALTENIDVINHDYKNRNNLVYIGETENDVPIWVNRLVVEADMVIGVGNIIPHRYCGWSGGGKIIVPGVCGQETNEATHLMLMGEEDIKIGSTENIALKSIYQVAGKVGLSFIVNVIMNAQKEVIDLVAGDPVEAHRVGIEKAQKFFNIPLPDKSDVVLIDSYPADLNLWQAGKALYSAGEAVKEGGIIILLTPCPEGIGEHEEFARLLNKSNSEICRLLDSGQIRDKLAAAAAYATGLVKKRAKIIIVSDGLYSCGLSSGSIKVHPVSEIQKIFDTTMEEYMVNNSLNIIIEGGEILPDIENKFKDV